MNATKLFTTLVLLKVNLTSAFLTPPKSTAVVSSSCQQYERTNFVRPLDAQTFAEMEAAAEKAVEMSVECGIDYQIIEQAAEYEAEKMVEHLAMYKTPIPQSPKEINEHEKAIQQEEQQREFEQRTMMKLEQQQAEEAQAQARAQEAARIIEEAQATISKDVIEHSKENTIKKKRFDIPRAAVSEPVEEVEEISIEEIPVEEISVEDFGPETRRMHGLKNSGKLVRSVLEEIALPTEYYIEEFLLDDEENDS